MQVVIMINLLQLRYTARYQVSYQISIRVIIRLNAVKNYRIGCSI